MRFVLSIVLFAIAIALCQHSNEEVKAGPRRLPVDYSDGLDYAIANKKFMVTWVGQQPIAFLPGTVTAYADSLQGYQTGDVIISGPWGSKHVIYETWQKPNMEKLLERYYMARSRSGDRHNVKLDPAMAWLPPHAMQDDDGAKRGPWPEGLEFPKGMVRYKRAAFTQSIAVVGGQQGDYDQITPTARSLSEEKWRVSGGMVGVSGYRSDLYRLEGKEPRTWIADIEVKNSLGYMQKNRGWLREYPDGAKFMDVLSADDKVFEVRQRHKVDGKWQSTVLYENERNRPKGYSGLSVSCASCHKEAGTGGYATGLVSGGDTVISDPFSQLEQ